MNAVEMFIESQKFEYSTFIIYAYEVESSAKVLT